MEIVLRSSPVWIAVCGTAVVQGILRNVTQSSFATVARGLFAKPANPVSCVVGNAVKDHAWIAAVSIFVLCAVTLFVTIANSFSIAKSVEIHFVKTVVKYVAATNAAMPALIAVLPVQSAGSVKNATQPPISARSVSSDTVPTAMMTTKSVNCAVNIYAGRKYAKLTTSQPVSSRTLRFVIDKIRLI